MQSHNPAVFLDSHTNEPGYLVKNYVSATSFITAPIPIMRRSGFSMALICPADGSPDGTVSIEISNDKEMNEGIPDSNIVNWVPLSGATSALTGASTIQIDDPKPQYRWMRVRYYRNSGSITATINLHTKAIT